MGAGSVPVEVKSPLALQLLLEVDLNVGVDAEGLVARRHHTSHGGWQTTDRALRAVATTLTIAS